MLNCRDVGPEPVCMPQYSSYEEGINSIYCQYRQRKLMNEFVLQYF